MGLQKSKELDTEQVKVAVKPKDLSTTDLQTFSTSIEDALEALRGNHPVKAYEILREARDYVQYIKAKLAFNPFKP